MEGGMIEHIEKDGELLAIIIRSGFTKEGIEFFTPDEYSQQLAYMKRPAGHEIEAHEHNPQPREVVNTLEVLFMKSGRMRADFYDRDRGFVASREVGGGDVLFLASGGHGFTMLEECEIFEVKQGPYTGDCDKTRFGGCGPEQG